MTTSMALLIFGGVVIAALGFAFLAPSQVHVERTGFVSADPDEVIALAASTAGYQRFNPYTSTDPNLKITPFGPESGVGSGFHFDGKDGKGSQTVASVTKNKVVYAIDLGTMGKPTQSITVEPAPGGTKVTWAMDADMGMNPVFRVFGLFMDGMMGAVFDRGLSNLART